MLCCFRRRGDNGRMTRGAVIGLGAMGSRIARRLLDAGHELVVWNRTPEKAAELVAASAKLAESPAAAARQAEVVITMVANPDALREVTEGADRIAAGVDESATVIETGALGHHSREHFDYASAPPTLVTRIPRPECTTRWQQGRETAF